MKGRVKKRVVIIAIIVIVIGGGIASYYYQRGFAPFKLGLFDKVEDSEEISRSYKLSDFLLCENVQNSTCVVVKEHIYSDGNIYRWVFPGKNIVCEEYEGTRYSIDKEGEGIIYPIHYTNHKLNFYDINTKALIKTIDLVEVIENFPEYYIDCEQGMFIERDGKEVYVAFAWPIDKSTECKMDRRYIVFDLESGKYCMEKGDTLDLYVKDVEVENQVSPESRLLYKYILQGASKEVQELIEKDEYHPYDIFLSNIYEDYIIFATETEYLPEKAEKLYHMFPHLKEYQGKARDTVVLFMSKDDVRELFGEK